MEITLNQTVVRVKKDTICFNVLRAYRWSSPPRSITVTVDEEYDFWVENSQLLEEEISQSDSEFIVKDIVKIHDVKYVYNRERHVLYKYDDLEIVEQLKLTDAETILSEAQNQKVKVNNSIYNTCILAVTDFEFGTDANTNNVVNITKGEIIRIVGVETVNVYTDLRVKFEVLSEIKKNNETVGFHVVDEISVNITSNALTKTINSSTTYHSYGNNTFHYTLMDSNTGLFVLPKMIEIGIRRYSDVRFCKSEINVYKYWMEFNRDRGDKSLEIPPNLIVVKVNTVSKVYTYHEINQKEWYRAILTHDIPNYTTLIRSDLYKDNKYIVYVKAIESDDIEELIDGYSNISNAKEKGLLDYDISRISEHFILCGNGYKKVKYNTNEYQVFVKDETAMYLFMLTCKVVCEIIDTDNIKHLLSLIKC